jgi:hypothetical protein
MYVVETFTLLTISNNETRIDLGKYVVQVNCVCKNRFVEYAFDPCPVLSANIGLDYKNLTASLDTILLLCLYSVLS